MLTYSEKFIQVLSRISYNAIAQSILNIQKYGSTEYLYDYIDTTNTNSIVSFTPTDKVKAIKETLPVTYMVTNIRNLTHSSSNDKIFKMLGYDKDSNEYWVPQPGMVGLILKECTSQLTGKTYALFQEISSNKLSVINRTVLNLTEDNSDIMFTKNRNTIKIGRLVNNMLSLTGLEYSQKEIEDFVNLFKSSYDFTNNAGMQFEIVSGDDIAKWYHKRNYQPGGGTLNNSCMCEKPPHIFDIYTKNSTCSMIILYSDEGKLKDGKYTSDKIKGRALLWDVQIDGQPVKFMDRVYTTKDSDTKLFEEWAKENGWWYKSQQSMYPGTPLTNGDVMKDIKVLVELNKSDIESFPYMDTLCFMTEEGFLTNDSNRGHIKEFRTTHGGYFSLNDDGDREEIYAEVEDFSSLNDDGDREEIYIEVEDEDEDSQNELLINLF